MIWQLALLVGLCAADPEVQPDASPAAQIADLPRLVRKAEMNYLARDWPEAARLYRQIVDANPAVGLYWYCLGDSLLQSKQYAAAIEPLEEADELGGFQPHPPRMVHRGEAAYLLAVAHARLGHATEATDWTRKSLTAGLRDIRKFQHEAFADLLTSAEFRELVCADALTQKADSPAGGFRRDLHFAVHELKRIHFAPFRAASEAHIDALVAQLDRDIPQLGEDQFFVRLMAIVREFGDAHTRMLRDQPLLPVRFFLFPEGLHILAATPPHADLVGAKVIAIADHPAAGALGQAERIVARENPMTPHWESPHALQSAVVLRGLGLAPENGPIVLEVEDASGSRRKVELAPLDKPTGHRDFTFQVPGRSEPLPLCLRSAGRMMWHELLPDGRTMYCQLNGIGHGELSFQRYFERLFAEIDDSPVERLILDLRWNNGGNTFLNPALIEGIQRSTKFRQPGKLFVVIGRNTFSAALNTTLELERRTTAILVGEPTSSPPNFVGESVRVVLPHTNWPVSISDLSWQTSYPMDYRAWLAPVMYAPPTAAAFRAHRDPALEAIEAYLKANGK